MKIATSLLAALLLLATSCTPQQHSLIITSTYPMPTTCAVSKPSVSQYAGYLNAGMTGAYYLIIGVDSLFEKIELAEGGNIAMLNQIALRYSTQAGPVGAPIGGFPEEETINASISVPPASADNMIGLDIIGPLAKQALLSVPATSPNEYFTLKVEIRLKGQLLSGGLVQTNSITYPLQVYSVPRTCTAPQVVRALGPCGNTGQDGSDRLELPASSACCTPDSVTGVCT